MSYRWWGNPVALVSKTTSHETSRKRNAHFYKTKDMGLITTKQFDENRFDTFCAANHDALLSLFILISVIANISGKLSTENY